MQWVAVDATTWAVDITFTLAACTIVPRDATRKQRRLSKAPTVVSVACSLVQMLWMGALIAARSESIADAAAWLLSAAVPMQSSAATMLPWQEAMMMHEALMPCWLVSVTTRASSQCAEAGSMMRSPESLASRMESTIAAPASMLCALGWVTVNRVGMIALWPCSPGADCTHPDT